MKIIKTFLLLLFITNSLNNLSAQEKKEFESDIIKIGIVASNLDSTLQFYTQIIGLTKVREFTMDSLRATKFGFTQMRPFHVVCLKTTDSPQATEVKILSFGPNSNYKKPVLLPDNLGMQYMTIYMTSVTPYIKRLKENNIKCLGETPSPTGDGRLLILVQDPNGVFVEVIGKE